MAVDDINTLRTQIPEVFSDIPVPNDWDDDWHIVPIDSPEQIPLGEELDARSQNIEFEAVDQPMSDNVANPPVLTGSGNLPDLGAFPGGPSQGKAGGFYPPPEAFAFYLPFHYFYPTWWGVYLILEPTRELARFICYHAGGKLSLEESIAATRIFLYAHEAFHHSVESFGTRLEITHRRPLYKEGFDRYYQRTIGSDDCLEEALATAHSLRRVKEKAFPNNKKKTEALIGALLEYVKGCPPGYRRGDKLQTESRFRGTRGRFAEDNQKEATDIAAKDPRIWDMFPHAFSGISRITSRVNYLVKKDSPLAKRLDLNLRYLRYRDLLKKLRDLAGCKFVREGKGGHAIWQSPDGRRFPVPRHPGDLPRGTLAKIIKEAGLGMSVPEFIAARA